MDHSYPLTTYDSYYGNFQDIGSPPSATYTPRSNRPFSIPRKPVVSGSDTNTDYTALIDPPFNNHYPPSHPAPRLPKGSILKWWFPEIFASFLSVASLLSIVIVLRQYEGYGLDELNLPSSLTLNGIVAAIATLNRVALMVPVGSAMSQEAWLWFSSSEQQKLRRSRLADLERSDAASRGAWGSLVFLFAARRRWLAYIGATVTILSLAFGAFSQQLLAIVEFPLTAKNANLRPGNIPRAETWQYYSGNPTEFSATLPFPLRAAIYNGILSDNIEPIVANCPTGNCTWPVTPSLAICSECVQSSFAKHCVNTTYTNNTVTYGYCNYTMPSGSVASLINTAGGTDDGPGFAVIPSKGAHFNSSLYNRLYIANFDVVGASYLSLAQGFTSANASECAMWMCVQAYNVSTRNNRQVQTLVEEYAYMNATPNSAGGIFGNYTFPNLPAGLNALPDTNYSITEIGVEEFYSTLYDMFNGTADLDIESSSAQTDSVDGVWAASADLDPWIKQVALSMTNALRNYTGPQYASDLSGTSPQPAHAEYNGVGYQLGVSVRWQWITLPAAMVLASFVFLLTVIVKTARSPVEAWKGSPLAFLFLDIDQEMKASAIGHTDRYEGIKNAIGHAPVVLTGEPGGIWTLKSS